MNGRLFSNAGQLSDLLFEAFETFPAEVGRARSPEKGCAPFCTSDVGRRLVQWGRAPSSCLVRLAVSAVAALAFACSVSPNLKLPPKREPPVVDSGFEVQPGAAFDAIRQRQVGRFVQSGLRRVIGKPAWRSATIARTRRIFRLQVPRRPFLGCASRRHLIAGRAGGARSRRPWRFCRTATCSSHPRASRTGTLESPPGLFEFTADGQFFETLELRAAVSTAGERANHARRPRQLVVQNRSRLAWTAAGSSRDSRQRWPRMASRPRSSTARGRGFR